MRFLTISAVALLLVLPVMAQPPAEAKKPDEPAKPAPGSLEDVIAQALRNSPEIHAAEAKVRSAEADLQKTRMEVLQKVTTAKFALEAAKKNVEIAKEVAEHKQKLQQKALIDPATARKAQLDLERAQAEVQRLESDLNAMLGRVPGRTAAAHFVEPATWRHSLFQQGALNQSALNPNWDPIFVREMDTLWHSRLNLNYGSVDINRPSTPGSITDRIRTALDQPLKLEAPKEGLPLAETLEMIRKKAGIEVPIRVLTAKKAITIELMAGELPLGAWLQAVEDSAPDIAIAVREYGILVTLKERMPRDAELMRDFWRRSRAEQAKAKEKTEPKK